MRSLKGPTLNQNTLLLNISKKEKKSTTQHLNYISYSLTVCRLSLRLSLRLLVILPQQRDLGLGQSLLGRMSPVPVSSSMSDSAPRPCDFAQLLCELEQTAANDHERKTSGYLTSLRLDTHA